MGLHGERQRSPVGGLNRGTAGDRRGQVGLTIRWHVVE